MPNIEIIPNDTLIFFDEMQECVSAATSLKAFREDGRYDVICSGSLMGINYKEIESNSVGNKSDYIMHSMDFEEFLWAKGYKDEEVQKDIKKMIDECIDDPKCAAEREEVRRETWVHPGEGAVRAADYLISKYQELTGKEDK